MATPIRPLSPVERWYWLCDQLSTLNVVSRTRVRGELSAEALRRGLDALQARHPLLRLAIEDDDGLDPRWVPTDRPIPLRHVRREHDDQWIREVDERELLDRVDPAVGPLARAVVIGDGDVHDLLVVVPHIIADGTTVLALARQWLELAAGDEPVESSRELPPPDALRPARHTGEEGAARLAEQTARDEELMARTRPGRVEPTTRVPLGERRSRLLHRELTGEQLDALARAAREHGTTVHGAITAALVRAAAADAGGEHDHFAVGSPIDFRGELEPPVRPDEVGTYVATVPSVVDPELPFWDLARAITDDLVERKLKGDHFNLVTMVVGACPPSVEQARPFMEFMEAEGPINLCSSNIGRYAFPDRIGPWLVSDAQFLTGISVNGYFVATVNSSHGKLFWNFTYIADAVPDDRARRMADDSLDTLLSEITQSSPAGA
ncbi:phthiocerol/phthiodiolone dimycocerosyl transferase family protein [Umezawaea sp. Da 62-37]|uniref:phthiocerol/phthiodiolone dimycocerosyl transferase family protein n=1 Tax=Umezawaea sp. Da 62-37 TaxID=3075927 RepID=UPI0028F7307E|nr:condensation domain-containing protein [Umezawaea sp. Da 62-37]WNV85395.1 condensation domain-containing protein [Umezawaea sp. Da 62-37]